MQIIKQGIVHRVTEGPCRYQAWPSVIQDENGVLYAADEEGTATYMVQLSVNFTKFIRSDSIWNL
jgi:hypothetical protein